MKLKLLTFLSYILVSSIVLFTVYQSPGTAIWYFRIFSFLGAMVLIPIILSAIFPQKTQFEEILFWGAGEYTDNPDDYVGNLGYWLVLSTIFIGSIIIERQFPPLWGHFFFIAALICISCALYRMKHPRKN